ncbi:MAG TPA: dihydrodipicolinate synthase family protein [Bryobacteraceae bacterium]|jgi:N-acetylneuraminate lyase
MTSFDPRVADGRLGGILPALVTPLDSALRLNVRALEALLARVYEAGVDGVYVCGSTGEGLLLPADVRRQVVEVATKQSPRGKQVIVHVGAWSFEEARALARHAEKAGAAAISSLPPNGASYAELLEHYRALAASTGLPFLAYYFPAVGGGPLSLEQLREICALPHVAGLKFTDFDLSVLSLLTREGKVVFNGRDEVLSAGLLMGATGGIGSIYNLVPEWFVELYRHTRAGRWAEAREIQDRVNDLVEVLLRYPFMPAFKRALTWQGIPCGDALRPRMPLSAEQERRLREELDPVLLDRAVPVVVNGDSA